MNKNCRPGIEYVLQLHEAEQNALHASLTKKVYTSTQEGMSGEPLPYQLRSDWMVTTILFVCFILVSYVLARGKKHLKMRFKNFSLAKGRVGLFDESTASDARHKLVLTGHTCILAGFCMYGYFSDYTPVLFKAIPHYLLLSLFIAYLVAFVWLKWLVYSFVNWIFFNKTKRKIWSESYFNVIIGVGFLLLPIVLLSVYIDLSAQNSSYLIISVIIIAKILLFYKCFTNFFNKIHGILHLILYFCALEIVPDLILWKGIILSNNILVLNF